MLTAKDDISDKVMGLDMGADDYYKTFCHEELLARIRTALRRKSGAKTQNGDGLKYKKNTIKAGNLELSKDEYKVTPGRGNCIIKKEFELLLYLMENKDIVLSRKNP